MQTFVGGRTLEMRLTKALNDEVITPPFYPASPQRTGGRPDPSASTRQSMTHSILPKVAAHDTSRAIPTVIPGVPKA